MATYTPASSVTGTILGTPQAWVAWARENGVKRIGDFSDYVYEIYRLARMRGGHGPQPHKLITQMLHETGGGTSEAWVVCLNPVGIGVTSDEMRLWYTFRDGDHAARAHYYHASEYSDYPIAPEIAVYRDDDPRAGSLPEQFRGTRTTLGSYGHPDWRTNPTWATDAEYGEKWARWLNRLEYLFADVSEPVEDGDDANEDTGDDTDGSDGSGGTGMKMIEHKVESAPRSLFLPDWVKVSVRWVTHPRTTSRTRVPLQTRSTFHDPGNPTTTHWAEWNWLAGGRQGGSLGGYNAITGAISPGQGEVIICQYLNEETWHAGTPDGNRTSWGTEAAYGAGMDWNTCFETACAWHGALLEAADRKLPEALVLHQFWTGKWCSAQVLNRGLTGVMHQKVAYYYTLARAARNGEGGVTPVEPTYATPVPVVDPATNLPWNGMEDVVVNGNRYEAQKITAATTANLNRRQWAGTESQLTGPVIPAGTEVDLLGWVKGELVDGISEWWVDTAGNRLWAGAIDAEPKEDPDWEDLPSEMPTGIVGVNGRPYYPFYPDDLTDEENAALNGAPPPLGRKITVQTDGKLYTWANWESGEVGDVAKGDEVVFKYWTRGECAMATDRDGNEYEECIWFAEDLHTGGRMWAGLSNEHPD